jgi:hypothetical protein
VPCAKAGTASEKLARMASARHNIGGTSMRGSRERTTTGRTCSNFIGLRAAESIVAAMHRRA